VWRAMGLVPINYLLGLLAIHPTFQLRLTARTWSNEGGSASC